MLFFVVLNLLGYFVLGTEAMKMTAKMDLPYRLGFFSQPKTQIIVEYNEKYPTE